MVNSIKRLNKFQIIGLLIQIISFIGCSFKIDGFTNWFWIGTSLLMMGEIFFTDFWGKEGKTRYRKLDKKRDKNLTRKTTEFIFSLVVIQAMIICLAFIIEFWVVDFSKRFTTIIGTLILTTLCLIIILMVVEKTFRQVDLIATQNDKIRK